MRRGVATWEATVVALTTTNVMKVRFAKTAVAWSMAVVTSSAVARECLAVLKVRFVPKRDFVRKTVVLPLYVARTGPAPRARCVGRALVDQAMGLSARRMLTARMALFVASSAVSTKAAVVP